MSTYSVLLSAARKRVQSPYSGPVAGELAAKVVLENLIVSPNLVKFGNFLLSQGHEWLYIQ